MQPWGGQVQVPDYYPSTAKKGISWGRECPWLPPILFPACSSRSWDWLELLLIFSRCPERPGRCPEEASMLERRDWK